ncbi:MAG: hypothetical protein Q8L48_43110 [Archangium sp.]|nr:hypothetical protein [Archangium sp.]
MSRLTKLLPLLLLSLTGCISRSLVGDPYNCQCAVPLLGRGGCGGFGVAFDTWACVAPGDSAVNACNNACMNVAGLGSGVFLTCEFPGYDVPAVSPAPDASRCQPPVGGTGSPLLATTGYESSPWDYVPGRSVVNVQNARDTENISLSAGQISLFMPEGHTNPGPMRFDLVSLVGNTSAFGFDGHTVSSFRLMNAGRFTATAGPGYAPPHAGQFNSYRIESGYPLAYTVVVDGVEISDLVSDSAPHTGYMYSDSSGQYLVYEGTFTLGVDPKNPITLTMHLEFRYGLSRPPAPTLEITRTDTGGTVGLTAKPGDSDPNATYTFIWVAGHEFVSKAPVLSTGPSVSVNPKVLGEDWVSVLVYANEAKIWRQQSVCLKPGGC